MMSAYGSFVLTNEDKFNIAWLVNYHWEYGKFFLEWYNSQILSCTEEAAKRFKLSSKDLVAAYAS